MCQRLTEVAIKERVPEHSKDLIRLSRAGYEVIFSTKQLTNEPVRSRITPQHGAPGEYGVVSFEHAVRVKTREGLLVREYMRTVAAANLGEFLAYYGDLPSWRIYRLSKSRDRIATLRSYTSAISRAMFNRWNDWNR